MSKAFIEVCRLIDQLQLKEMQQVIPLLETRIEQLENAKWRDIFQNTNIKFPITTTNFKSNYDIVTHELDGLSIEYSLGEIESETNVEFEITTTSVAIAVFTDDVDHITNTWEVFGTPKDFNISDSSYNVDPDTQMRMPPQVFEYMLFLWNGFLKIASNKQNE
jgi:hypothetical protein